MKQFDPIENMIFNGITGSRLYGTFLPDSDYDYRGVTLPPLEVLLNPFENFEQKDSGFEEEDRVIYSLAQFFKLCANANPNITEILFIPESHWLHCDDKWLQVLENRNLFLSNKAKFCFAGYSISQFNKIKRHRRYFVNPLDHKPTRKEFGLTDQPTISGDGLQAVANISKDLLNPKFVDEIYRELNYRQAMKEWHDFISWRDSRNPRRKRLEEAYGYDCISASHLVRLMSEGEELLLTGHITFPLPNAEHILEIKLGKYSYERVVEIAEDMDNNFNNWLSNSVLSKAPNRNKLSELYFDLIKQ